MTAAITQIATVAIHAIRESGTALFCPVRWLDPH
jgi:hypothetical protein